MLSISRVNRTAPDKPGKTNSEMRELDEISRDLLPAPTAPERASEILTELESFAPEKLDQSERGRLLQLKVDAAVLAGKPERAVQTFEHYLERAEVVFEVPIWTASVCLLDAPESENTSELVRMAPHSSDVLIGGSLLYRLLERDDVESDDLRGRPEVDDVLAFFYSETGMTPLDHEFRGFRELFSVFQEDRGTIDEAIGEGVLPERTELETAYWRDKLLRRDVPGLEILDL